MQLMLSKIRTLRVFNVILWCTWIRLKINKIIIIIMFVYVNFFLKFSNLFLKIHNYYNFLNIYLTKKIT